MKLVSILVCLVLAGHTSGQSAFGLRTGISDIKFFKPNSDDLYYSEYVVEPTECIGISWVLKTNNPDLIFCSLMRDEVNLSYVVGQFLNNASFANISEHKLVRYVLKGESLWEIASWGRLEMFLGPGAAFTYTEVKDSRGEGFDIQLLQWTDTATGRVITYPGPVYWSYEGRNRDAIHIIHLTGSAALELQFALSERWALNLGSSVELSLTPWVSEEHIRFTLYRGFEGHFGIHYWLRGRERDP